MSQSPSSALHVCDVSRLWVLGDWGSGCLHSPCYVTDFPQTEAGRGRETAFLPVSSSSPFLITSPPLRSLYIKPQPRKTRTLPCSNELWENGGEGEGAVRNGRQKRSRLAAGRDYGMLDVCIYIHAVFLHGVSLYCCSLK